MTAPSDRVRSKTGTPVASDFSSSSDTPIVFDVTAATGRAYFMDAAGTIREVGDILTNQTLSGYQSVGSGAGVFFGVFAALAANADLTISNAFSGLFVIRNSTDGGVAVVTLEHGLGVRTEISDPAAFLSVAGADPGAGSNQIWFTNSGTTVTLRNRYGASKNINVTMMLFTGTPS